MPCIGCRRGLAFISFAAALAVAWPGAWGASFVRDYHKVIVLHDFGANEPGLASGGLTVDGEGNLYGIETGSFAVGSAVFKLTPPPPGALYKGWKETVLYTFPAGGVDGQAAGTLVIDRAGNLYGVASGGARNCGFGGGEAYCGEIFELSPPAAGQTAWTETTLYMLDNDYVGGVTDGYGPTSLAIDSAGNLYGATIAGGNVQYSHCSSQGCGTVFRLSPPAQGDTAWNFTVLYAPTDALIGNSVVPDRSGNLYGVFSGYAPSAAFKLSPPPAGQTDWTETDIAKFNNYTSISGLTFDGNGNLFGTHGREYPGHEGGDVFKLSPPATGTRWNQKFVGRLNVRDGYMPGGVILDGAGNAYGTASRDYSGTIYAPFYGKGTVFKVAPDGTVSEFVRFSGGRLGTFPTGGLVLDAAGNLYGMTSSGGTNGTGAVYEILAQ